MFLNFKSSNHASPLSTINVFLNFKSSNHVIVGIYLTISLPMVSSK